MNGSPVALLAAPKTNFSIFKSQIDSRRWNQLPDSDIFRIFIVKILKMREKTAQELIKRPMKINFEQLPCTA